tara:strand:+ start:373 stop:1440 length:1068 start_codon:yes stop_codon:yes gene_type:complete
VNLFKRIIFYIFKPLNPIDVYQNRSVYSFSLFKRVLRLVEGDIKQIFLIPKHLVLKIISLFYIIPAFLFFFFNYKFIYVNFWQIGAPPQEVGTIVKYLKMSGFREKKIIFLNPKFISLTAETNKLYKKKIVVIENFFLYLILVPFLTIKNITIRPYLADSSHLLSKYNLVNKLYEKSFKTNEIFKIKEKEKFFLKKIIKNLNLKKFVVVNIRQNKNYFSYRNITKIQNYKKSINFLLKNNYDVIRFMESNDERIKIAHKNFYQINAEKINLYYQFKFYRFAKFAIVTQSGPAGYASILDTPFILTNSIDRRTNLTPKESDIIIYKNKSREKNKLYNDNTSIQILNSVKKMDKKIS